ncbi:MAG: NAD-binding protein [Streptococcaceae bacterium]|jgi:trk system potassium uptake protein TrkA|nr:NAD-binding protein [Streptococcaceae bacterium]MCH4178230.1 NAD-binding protein [Streptococcaceae bacterium]
MDIIIVGGGQVGSYVGRRLLDSGNRVKIIEHREHVMEALKNIFPEDVLVYGDGADPRIMEKAGISRTDVLAVVTGADEINLVASTIAKFEFGVDKVIARVNNPKNEWLYTFEMGVDVKVSQADLLSNIIIDQIDMENVTTLMRLNRGDASIIELTIKSGSKVENVALKDLHIPKTTVLIAIQRAGENIVARGETVLEVGDHILAYTNSAETREVYQLFN